MKHAGTARLVALLTLFAAVFGAESSFSQPEQSRETILRLHGSNTIGAKLAPDLAQAFLRQLGADSVKQTELVKDTETDVEGYFSARKQSKVIEIRAHGSATAFKGLKEKRCDIGMASRKINENELNELAFLGDMSSSACEHVVALDGVAVIVNPANAAVTKLSFPQLADLFSGNIKNWSELSWSSGLVNLHARDENSGTHDTFKQLILNGKKLDESAKRWDANEQLADAVAADAHAVGYCALPNVKSNKALAISDGGPAVRPTVFTVAAEDYPVSRRLHLYSPARPENKYTKDFIEFALSKEGQVLVKKHKFVDLTITAEKRKLEAAPGNIQNHKVLFNYLTSVGGAKRLSASFRFKGESFELDNRAVRDVERLAEFLAENQTTDIVLAGFSASAGDAPEYQKIQGIADSSASYAKNLDLSCKRAEAVKKALNSRGINVQEILCVGSEMPIASNHTEAGRAKNRRVEVWLR